MRVNEQAEELMAQYLHLGSWTLLDLAHSAHQGATHRFTPRGTPLFKTRRRALSDGRRSFVYGVTRETYANIFPLTLSLGPSRFRLRFPFPSFSRLSRFRGLFFSRSSSCLSPASSRLKDVDRQ